MAVAIPAVSFWASSPEQAKMTTTDNSTKYQPVVIININPEDLMPKVELWDKNVYKHIEHLRVPESTVISDMMWKYGAGNHSPEEYQQLMNRLNTGMVLENPIWYDNYGTIWWNPASDPSNHAHIEWSILNTLVDHANFKVVNPKYGNWYPYVQEVVNQNPNNIYIFWISAYATVDKEKYLWRDNNSFKNLWKSKNFLIFIAWSNINTKNWILRNKIYHEDIDWDEHWVYGAPSPANWKKDNNADRHMIVTIWTNSTWNIDQTDEIYESSKYPVWFHNNVLFAWRAFPYHSANSWKIEAEKWKYATSFTNYSNVCFADLCFQMKADVADVNELLEMIRATALTDYIRLDLNGDGDTDDNIDGQPESQPLQLMNPAWFFKEYLMPTSLPTSLKANETTPLEKWYYHGVIFQIPGAEVNINGQWIAFTNENKELIFSQNPMNLEWRLNGDLLNNYNYKPWDTVSGQIIVVDDQWNGLNITKDFSVNVESASDINTVTLPYATGTWFTIDGIHLDAKPTIPGVYIVNGQKVTIK